VSVTNDTDFSDKALTKTITITGMYVLMYHRNVSRRF